MQRIQNWPEQLFLPPPFQNVNIPTLFGCFAAKLVKNKMIYRPVNLRGGQNFLTWRQILAGKRRVLMSWRMCCRDECRRRMVQGEFEVGGGGGGPGSGVPGPGLAGHGGGGQAGGAGAPKLPASPDSPVSDVNSILAGAHLQVRERLFNRF